MTGIRLPNVDQKGQKILLLGKNLAQLQEIEARTEVDPDFARVDVFTADTLSAATRIAREQGVTFAVIEDGTDGKDFVHTLLEIRHASPACSVSVLVKTPQLSHVREAHRAGGLHDFGDPDDLANYTKIKAHLLSYIRAASSQPSSLDLLPKALLLQKALLIGFPTWQKHKQASGLLLNEILQAFDLSSVEKGTVLVAEKVFFPALGTADYSSLLGAELTPCIKPLLESASWESADSKPPTSTAGFSITLANFLAAGLEAGVEQLVAQVASRPTFLKHSSLRVFGDKQVRRVLSSVEELLTGRKAG